MKNKTIRTLAAGLVSVLGVANAQSMDDVSRNGYPFQIATPREAQADWCDALSKDLVMWGGDGWACWTVVGVEGSGGCTDNDGNTWSEPNPC